MGKPVICPTCSGRFPTTSAMEQHAAAKHQNQRRKRPTRRTGQSIYNTNPMFPNSMVLTRAINQDLTKLSKLGLTEAGHKWALKALHPCDESKSELVPIPDNATSDVACAEIRHSRTLGAPSGATGNWDCQILVIPTSDIPAAFRTRPSGGAWSPWQALLTITPNFTPGLVQIASAGNPFQALVDPGLNKLSEEWRQLFRGMTIVHDASALANQGMVTAGQWGAKSDIISDHPMVNGATTTPEKIDFLVFTDVPDDDDKVVMKCPSATQWEARNGVYLPMRFNDPTHLFSEPTGSEFTPAGSNTATKIGMPVILSGTGDTWSILGDSIQVPGSAPGILHCPTTSGGVNQMVGTAIFQGLDKSSSLVVKLRSGIEFVPTTGTEALWMAKTRCPEDAVAIKNVQIIGNKIPMQFPHKYNSLGWLLPLIKQAAKGAWAIAAPWLGQKITEW